jgi:hypothetical protein
VPLSPLALFVNLSFIDTGPGGTTFSDLNRFRSCLGFALSEMSESDSDGFWPCDGLANGTKWMKSLHRKKELTQAKYKNETLSKRRRSIVLSPL